MSDNSHIDKIFKDGIGEVKFSNADAMWQKMDAELNRDDKRKRRPVVYFVALAGLLAVVFFTFRYYNKPVSITEERSPITANAAIKPSIDNVARDDNKTQKNLSNKNIASVNTINADNSSSSVTKSKKNLSSYKASRTVVTITAPAAFSNDSGSAEEGNSEETNLIESAEDQNDYVTIATVAEKINADINHVSADELKQPLTSVIPALDKETLARLEEKRRRELPKAKKISIELVAGRDFLRMNRKAGSYIGVRMNRLLDNGTAITVGVSYATNIVLDRYRLVSKPSEQVQTDARLNDIASIRVPIYLQRQLAKSKFSMMIGLVPTYITKAEVFNVPDSYVGNPDPFRKFTVNDLNRFNILFGAGLKFSPTNWMAIELSGSYSLTGMVKDGYKNQSRVNDNFKSIQAGFAFRLK